MPLGDLRQAHAGTTVLDNLFAVHIESRSSDLATFGTGASHATAYTLDQKCPFHLAQHRNNAEESPSQCSRGVERFAQGDELDFAGIEFIKHLKEVFCR